jgi:small subunit ribosomal protein S19e
MATAIATTSSNRSVSVRDVAPAEFIATYAKFLKKSGKLQLPKWVDLVKTATWKQLPPMNPDWYYVRAGNYKFIP